MALGCPGYIRRFWILFGTVCFSQPWSLLYGTVFLADRDIPKVFFNLKRIFWQHPECYERLMTDSNVFDHDNHVFLQVRLLETVKDMVFQPTVEVLYGTGFVTAQDMVHLQRLFFDFEAGFELAASPVPHIVQRPFSAARKHLLAVFRWDMMTEIPQSM